MRKFVRTNRIIMEFAKQTNVTIGTPDKHVRIIMLQPNLSDFNPNRTKFQQASQMSCSNNFAVVSNAIHTIPNLGQNCGGKSVIENMLTANVGNRCVDKK